MGPWTVEPASKSAWTAIAILAVAAFLRIYALGFESLWCDEAYTALTVRLPFSQMISELFRTDDAPPLFYILAKLNRSLMGDSEASLRVVSVATGTAAVGALAAVAYLRRSSTDLWAAGFMAVAATGVFHSRQARSYSLLLLASTGIVLSARAMLLEGRRAGPILAASTVAACLTHHVGIILVLTSLVLWPLGTGKRPRLSRWILWHLPALLTWSALWIGASAQLGIHMELNTWIAHYWEARPFLLAPLYSMGLFLPAGLSASEASVGYATPGQISMFWTLVSIGCGSVCLVVAGRRSRLPRREVLLEAGFVMVPLLALLIASAAVTPVYVLGRTDVLAYPAFVLLVGRGLSYLPRYLSRSFLAFWAVMSLMSLAPTYGLGNLHLAKGVDERVVRTLKANGLASEDWVIHTFMSSPTIEYYAERHGVEYQAAWFPAIAGENTASAYPTPSGSVDAYIEEARQLIRRMEDTVPENGEAWIFAVLANSTPELVGEIREAGSVTVEQLGYPTSLLVYSLVGKESAPVSLLYHQDWVAGERVILRIPRRSWLRPQDLPPVEFRFR